MTVTLRYWAAAAAATGVDSEEHSCGTVGEILDAATTRHPDLARVRQVASVIVDGVPARDDVEVPAGATVEILPPFAGG
ncbi:MoaD/ThiS family protein [Mobilicoccus massiliensis]|uniref:MoaD/ThiS family protein n=1 Tax=Mobilicoccus massiliensis TaxID=1522310 RepID=UPI00058B2D39|nr:MoaD/ThiS family protein [Mobilicoccus massiliensis]